MTATKRTVSIILTLAMVLSTLLAMIIPTSAATKSNGTKTQTITVTTKANWLYPGSESITLSQAKGTLSQKKLFSKNAYQSYGCWDVSVVATDGSHSYTKNFDGSSIKLDLKRNKTYKITVSWDDQATFFKTVGKGSFVSCPTWKVKSTHKVSSCS